MQRNICCSNWWKQGIITKINPFPDPRKLGPTSPLFTAPHYLIPDPPLQITQMHPNFTLYPLRSHPNLVQKKVAPFFPIFTPNFHSGSSLTCFIYHTIQFSLFRFFRFLPLLSLLLLFLLFLFLRCFMFAFFQFLLLMSKEVRPPVFLGRCGRHDAIFVESGEDSFGSFCRVWWYFKWWGRGGTFEPGLILVDWFSF